MPVGTVKWFNATKGCGFIGLSDGSKDIVLHSSALARAALTTLMQHLRIRHELAQGNNGNNSVENWRPV